METVDLRLTPREAAEAPLLKAAAARALGVAPAKITHVEIVRRSIDARQRRVMVNVGLRVWVDEAFDAATYHAYEAETFAPVGPEAPTVIVVGAGPAGLFAALGLIQQGKRPIVLERGRDVDSRRRDLAAIARTDTVDPDSNYAFGEGGAGAYSDGKLYTRSKKRGPVERVLRILHQHGAEADILVDAHPHIGTDRLPGIIRALRQTIERCGGEVHFGMRVTDLLMRGDGSDVEGVITADHRQWRGPVILATGHSARDVYRLLIERLPQHGLTPKGIAMGVRLEHPQRLIDVMRYHAPEGRGPYLPPAEYTVNARSRERGVYSFCMCPGGVVIPAATEPDGLVVNGMSSSGRVGRLGNSGLVVEVLPEDIPAELRGEGPLAMMAWQREIERRFWRDGHSHNAPAQRMTDFMARRPSATLPAVSYAPGVHAARLDELLPPFITERLIDGFRQIGAKHRGFITPEAVMIGCETRTSAPVRVPREAESLHHPAYPSLYPCGEGAGYAGGIVSAALDGLNVAAAVR